MALPGLDRYLDIVDRIHRQYLILRRTFLLTGRIRLLSAAFHWCGLTLFGLGLTTAAVVVSEPPPNLAGERTVKFAQLPSSNSTLPSVRTNEKSEEFAATKANFELYKQNLVLLARASGVREPTIQREFATITLSDKAIQLDRAQRPAATPVNSISPPLSPYLRIHVTPTLISRGQSRYYQRWPDLIRIYTRYGVDPAVLMSIYGKETGFGSVTGNFDLLNVLGSLAFEGRRRAMFESEFIAALKLIEAGVPRERLRGSYAGATGYPQFMPTVVLRLRADGDGDGQADIWANEIDALASIANYLKEAGWKPGVPWGAEVIVPPGLNRAVLQRTEQASKCPAVFRRHTKMLSVSQWQLLGVRPRKDSLPANALAALMEPGSGEPAYLLTENYNAILEYNCSNFYAMSVALLADRIARR